MSSSSQTSPPQTNSQFLSFALTPKTQAMLPTQHLAETFNLDLSKIVQIPEIREKSVVGVCYWRGEVLWLVDIAYFLGFEPLLTPDYNQSKCGVLRVTTHGNTLGFLVESVGELIRIETAQIQSSENTKIDLNRNHCIQGTLANSFGENLLILDIEEIFASL
ncbi:MAG: chemotaxis protein CheW [Moorea sp. SIO2B7]|nr:chemotaxis protein CheW [Moorena sp. SIO2B7]